MNKVKQIKISADIIEMVISQTSKETAQRFIEQAIVEKLEREMKREKVAYSDNFKPL